MRRCLSFIWVILFLGLNIACAQAPEFEEKEYPVDFLTGLLTRMPEEEILRIPDDSMDIAVVLDSTICLFRTKADSGAFHLRLAGRLGKGQIVDFIEHGDNPGQMTLPAFSYGDNKILLYDSILGVISLIDIKSAFDKDYFPVSFETGIVSQRVAPIGDRLMFLNPYSFTGEQPRIVFTGRNGKYPKKEIKVNMLNVLFGNLFSGDKADSIVFVSENSPIIEIFDYKGHLRKRVYFPHKESKWVKFDLMGTQTYVFEEPVLNCFWDSCAGNQYIAALYDDESGGRIVLILDWDGNILDSFRPEGLSCRVSLSSDEKYIYSWETDGSDKRLVKYPILP